MKEKFKLKTSYEEVRAVVLLILIAFIIRPVWRKFINWLIKQFESILVQLGIPQYISYPVSNYIIAATFLYVVLYLIFLRKNPHDTQIKKALYIWITFGIVFVILSIIGNRLNQII